VAKGVTLVGVRVLNCQGSGTTAGVVAGIDWVTANAIKPAVANMSLGGGADTTLDAAVQRSIAAGITYAIAAGNGDIFGNPQNACTASPARVPEAITVGATQSNDAKASFSNFGTCLDVFAPGVGITSAWGSSDTATNTISGTSMATPHTTGVAALILSANPTFTPQQVRDKLVNDATAGVVTSPGTGSPNRLLFVAQSGVPSDDFSLSVAPTSGAVNPGSSASATVTTATTSGTAQQVTFSASGLPSGATATFSPASVASGGTSTLTIGTSASTPPGTYQITITGTGPSATRTATFTLTVNGPPGCSATNPTDVQIPDQSTVESQITISGCAGNASATSTVEVHIVHTYQGDLVVTLVAPDGTGYVLQNRTGGDTDNIDQTYTVNLSTKIANGTWRLRVQDAAAVDTGFINSWTLNLGGGGTPPPVTRYEAENAAITQGVVASNHAGFSGTGFVDYNAVVGSAVQWTVTATTAGPARLTFRFANGSTANRPMNIAVNGTVVAAGQAFAGTGGWATWSTVTVQVNLTAGTNTVRATATAASGGPNVDYLEVS
jgi:subtilisin-like proprotein convertase family protein